MNTCADFQWTPLSNSFVICQYVVKSSTNGAAAEGDSGSPVFRLLPQPGSSGMTLAELYGVLWARAFGSHLYFIFSPMSGVEADLRPLDYLNICLSFPNPC